MRILCTTTPPRGPLCWRTPPPTGLTAEQVRTGRSCHVNVCAPCPHHFHSLVAERFEPPSGPLFGRVWPNSHAVWLKLHCQYCCARSPQFHCLVAERYEALIRL